MHTCYDFVQSEYNTFFEIAKSKAGLTKKQKNIKVIKAVVSSVMRRYAGPGRRIYRDF